MKPGQWLFTTRDGAERDLADELALRSERSAEVVGRALVVAARAPASDGRIELTFARQGFRIESVRRAATLAELAESLGADLRASVAGAERYALQVWVPDTEEGNRLSDSARELRERLEARLAEAFPAAHRVDTRELTPDATLLVQVCLFEKLAAAAGAGPASRALSLAPGGRLRAKVGGDRPSRSARKLAEALLWLGVGPEPGEVCVDLGAAPGGWTWVLLERRARVIAVDPAKLRPDLLKRRGLRHFQMSAFDFTPEEPVDWLFCDMAWRPQEVAKMLARWARQRSATFLVANFKLPMKRKAEMVKEVRQILESGGWKAVRARQLYHDRDEVTVTARAV